MTHDISLTAHHSASGHTGSYIHQFISAIVRGAGYHIGYTMAAVVLVVMLIAGAVLLIQRTRKN